MVIAIVLVSRRMRTLADMSDTLSVCLCLCIELAATHSVHLEGLR